MLDTTFGHASHGEKSHAHDLIEAIRILKADTPVSEYERERLARFPGFGCVALSIFPDPQTGQFKPGWEQMGTELASLLTPEEYTSARRSVFAAFYTSPIVMRGMFEAFKRMGLPDDALVLEPGAGIGNFMAHAPVSMHFIGVEMDDISGRIAQLIHPQHDIRIENFRDSRLPPLDAVIGNPPFADIGMDHNGHRFSLHDFFFAKSVDALAPGGVLGLVTSRFTLDKRDTDARDYLAERADFLGAIRLPDDAFREQGTKVVTDIIFLQKREPGQAPRHAGNWRDLADIGIGIPVNAWYAEHPDMVMGEWAVGRGMYNAETLKVRSTGDLTTRLRTAIETLPEGIHSSHSVAPGLNGASQTTTAPPGLGEGSFFVAADGGIMQIECGNILPVCHGSTPLRAYAGLMGRRLAALIDLRDRARAVLRSQNEGSDDRETPRKALNRTYDRFTASFGPINKTTFSKNAQGNEIRRMPNIARFREDPDAFLVMSLEDYDEAADRAAKAQIMTSDVVGRVETITHVETAEAGLLVSLNERGRVDLNHIAALYGRERSEVLAELGDLVFEDPETGHVTRDEYLSGNVRRKLEVARAAGMARNVAALEAIQPEDLLPGDIDANLGAPWIPQDVIQAFTAEMMGVEPGAITIGHMAKDAVWTVEGGYDAQTSVANTDEHGTKRLNGLSLLEMALNMRSPTVYDEFKDPDGSTHRVVNQEETIAAREKQKRIKQRFSGWVFADPDQAERLVRLYNDTFNNLRLREFDGSHLTFPGMNPTFKMRPHQTGAVWRIISDGNTLLAHVVGAGKTAVMCAAAMKLKQAGLVRTSALVCPNHMLEQFGREFLHLYPNAKLLIAGKEDLARDRRKLLTAKIATGEWDAVIMTHSSFERIGMSVAFQREFIEAQLADYEALLIDAKANDKKDNSRAHRNIIKTIEKRKASYEDKLDKLKADAKKDDGLVFDDLGVGQLFIDELHHMKNLEAATKMDRVAGIQTEGSQRAFDIFMKSRYIDGLTPGRGFVGATGTPISNTMVEMFTMIRYLAPALLVERGIAHFDAWAAAFGEVVDTMEISPDGASLRPNARFSKFVNLPELQQIFRSFADVQTADMLKLPVPALCGGKADVVSCPMSFAQSAIQTDLVKRYERVRGGGVDPREDNALKITTDGRKLALDARLNDGETEAWEQSKLYAMADRAVEIWTRTTERRGTQMIFCDIGVNPTAWGFSVYDEIKALLRERGVPPEQIADIGDANTDAKKAEMFKKMRAGSIRFMIGSTAKMGTGTNVQKLLVAMHHLDAPWKPAEIEQRDGRILRQGNSWKEVEIYRYVTEGSFDAFMWQTLQTKARFIAQVMKGDIGVRRASDIGGQELSFAEVKAIASGNPAVLTLAEIDADIQRMTLLKRSHADEQYRARQAVKFLPDEIERLKRRTDALEADHAAAEGEAVTIGTRTYADREKASEAMNIVLKGHLATLGDKPLEWEIGAYRGLKMTLAAEKGAFPELIVTGNTSQGIEFKAIAAGALLNRIDTLIEQMPFRAQSEREKARIKAGQLEGYGARIGLPFEQEGRLVRLQEIRHELETLLSGTEGRERIDTLVTDYAAMKSDVPPPVPPVAQPELPVVEDIAPVVKLDEPVELPTPAVVIPFPVPSLADAWGQKPLFDKPKVQRQVSNGNTKRTVARPVQLSLF